MTTTCVVGMPNFECMHTPHYCFLPNKWKIPAPVPVTDGLGGSVPGPLRGVNVLDEPPLRDDLDEPGPLRDGLDEPGHSGMVWMSLHHSGMIWMSLRHSGMIWMSLGYSGMICQYQVYGELNLSQWHDHDLYMQMVFIFVEHVIGIPTCATRSFFQQSGLTYAPAPCLLYVSPAVPPSPVVLLDVAGEPIPGRGVASIFRPRSVKLRVHVCLQLRSRLNIASVHAGAAVCMRRRT